MLTIIAASLVLSQALNPAEEAKKEYVAFVERMAKVESVSCTLVNSGGPVPPRYEVVRMVKGNIYAVYTAHGESHSNGAKAWHYNLEQNSYYITPTTTGYTFSVAFGQTLCPGELKNLTFTKVVDIKVDGVDVRAIDMKWSGNKERFELYISKESGMPAGWIFYGNQSNYVTLIKEAEYNIKINPETLKWTPPLGAKDKTP